MSNINVLFFYLLNIFDWFFDFIFNDSVGNLYYIICIIWFKIVDFNCSFCGVY